MGTGYILQVHLSAVWNLEHVFPLKQEGTWAHLTRSVLHCNTAKQFFMLFFKGLQTHTPVADTENEESWVREIQNGRDCAAHVPI